jgi:hypothetical protein
LTFIEYFDKFLEGRHFTLRCDNHALSWLKSYRMSTKNAMVARWIQRLDRFNFTIEHRLRHRHTNADGLSKKREYYERQEQALDIPMQTKFKFMTQEEYDALPVLTDDPSMPEGYKITFSEISTQTPPPDEELKTIHTDLGKITCMTAKQRYTHREMILEQENDGILKAYRHMLIDKNPKVDWMQTLTKNQKRWFTHNRKDLEISEHGILQYWKRYQNGTDVG